MIQAAPQAPGAEPWTREAAVLALEGGSYKVRCGKRIWCERPDDAWSGWLGEQEAYRRLTEGEK